MINPRSGAQVEGMSKAMIEELIEAYGNGAAVAVTSRFPDDYHSRWTWVADESVPFPYCQQNVPMNMAEVWKTGCALCIRLSTMFGKNAVRELP